MQTAANPEYVLGHREHELQRLALQAQYWGDATLELLRQAGVAPGMRLLDIGCGAGDVSLLAATLVGPSGLVVGVDRSPEAIAAATNRANSAGMTQVRFQVANLDEYSSEQPFDGVIGRFVLMYFADPAATLKRLLRLVRPGGVVAFLEMDMTAAHSVPPVALVETAAEWVRETFRRGRVALDLGPQVWRIFRAIGLPDPVMMVRWKAEAAPAADGTRYLAETIRSLLPMMERAGVASASQVDVETLSARLQDALVADQSTLLPPAVVGTWSRVQE